MVDFADGKFAIDSFEAVVEGVESGHSPLNLLEVSDCGAKSTALDSAAATDEQPRGGLLGRWHRHQETKALSAEQEAFTARQAESEALRATPGFDDAVKDIANQMVRATRVDGLGNLGGKLDPGDFSLSGQTAKLEPAALKQAFDDSLTGLRGADWYIDTEVKDAGEVAPISRSRLPFRQAPAPVASTFEFPKTTITGVPRETTPKDLPGSDWNGDVRDFFGSGMPTPGDVLPVKQEQFEQFIAPAAMKITAPLLYSTRIDEIGNLEGFSSAISTKLRFFPPRSGVMELPDYLKHAVDFSADSLRGAGWTVDVSEPDEKYLFPSISITGVPTHPEKAAFFASGLNTELRESGLDVASDLDHESRSEQLSELNKSLPDLNTEFMHLFDSGTPTPDDVLSIRLAEAERSRAWGLVYDGKREAADAEETKRAISTAQDLVGQATISPHTGELYAAQKIDLSSRQINASSKTFENELFQRLKDAGWDASLSGSRYSSFDQTLEIRGMRNTAIDERADGIKTPAQAWQDLKAGQAELPSAS